MTKRTRKQSIMRELWVGAIVAFFLFLAADPLQISTLKVQAQVMIMEDGCIFDPVWYCSEYPQGAGARELAEKPEAETEDAWEEGSTADLPEAEEIDVQKEEEPEEDQESFLEEGMTTAEIYRQYQLYGQGAGQLPYDASLVNGTMLEEVRKASAAKKQRYEKERGISWNVITSKIYDTDEVKIWDTEYLISDEDEKKLSDIIDEFEDDGYEIGFVLVDLKTGDAISYHAGAEIYSASVIKAPYIFSLLDQGIQPTRDMFLAGNQSDNDAYVRIRRAYGNQIFADWIAGTGIPERQSQTRYIMTTPLDLCRMFYKGTRLLLGEDEYSDWARNTFTDSLNSAIALTVGESEDGESGDKTDRDDRTIQEKNRRKIYSKAGWIASDSSSVENSYTNGAIVDGDYPYVVTVMSNSPGYVGIEYAKDLMPILDEIHDEMVNPEKTSDPDARAADVTDFASKAQSAAKNSNYVRRSNVSVDHR